MKSYKDYPKINNDRINFSKISGNNRILQKLPKRWN